MVLVAKITGRFGRVWAATLAEAAGPYTLIFIAKMDQKYAEFVTITN